jgi:dihydrofolate synthase/folylpolyglutamate synthase
LEKVNPEKFLNSLINYEKIPGYNYDLTAFERLLHALGNPHKRLNNAIHIGGTKGKGSVAAMLSACLEACGYTVGTYTSPHLHSVHERILVNAQSIHDRDLEKFIRIIHPHIKKSTAARTYFEIVTAIAFLYFLSKKTDFTVLEVGLGGRLDATNVTRPLLSVITKIGYDHTQLLGKSLGLIAREKAGIIKERGHLITTDQRPSAQRVLVRAARWKKNSVTCAPTLHTLHAKRLSLKGTSASIHGDLGSFDAFIPLAGSHQLENLNITLAVLYELQKMGFNITVKDIKKGLKNTKLHGRFETVSTAPLVIYDCAHNQDSFKALADTIKSVGIKKFCLIFGSNLGKDYGHCVRHIFPKAREVFLVKTNSPRTVEPLRIYEHARKFQKKLTIASSVSAALECIKVRKKHPCTIVTGSFYLWQKEWCI